TNGILITPAVADRIAALHPYAVELSVYSATNELHDRITRVKRSWELTTRAFRLLRERGVRTAMKTPLMRENVRDLQALKVLASELGATFRYDITITQKDSGGLDPLKHRLTDNDLLWLMREEIQADRVVARHHSDQSRTCSITLNGIVIDPYGRVSPCIQVRKEAGNLRARPLKEIWEHSQVWTELGNLTLGTLPVCRTCELNGICVRCHGLALAEDGDIRAPALVNCREALARRQAMMEKGLLPADFPIPAHLQAYVDGRGGASRNGKDVVNFIPVEQVTVRL
ncbi:MAG: SPASM domain-containing protein, partial [Rudaea sp.]